MFVDEVKYLSLKYAWKKRLFHIFVTRVYLTVCSFHITCVFQSECTLYSCLNFKELFCSKRAVSTWMSVYELSGCGLESCCSPRAYFWRYFWPKEEWPIGILKYILYFKNEGLNISWISRYNSILGLKNGFHNTVFYSVSIWT